MALQTAIKHLDQGEGFGDGYRVVRFLRNHTEEDFEIHLYTVMYIDNFKEGYIIYKDGEEIVRCVGIYDDIKSILYDRMHREFLFEMGISIPNDDKFIWRRFAAKRRGEVRRVQDS